MSKVIAPVVAPPKVTSAPAVQVTQLAQVASAAKKDGGGDKGSGGNDNKGGGGNDDEDDEPSHDQYKPGKGCGDDNHVHSKGNECKPPKEKKDKKEKNH